MYPEDEPKRAELAERGSRMPLSEQEKCLVELHDVISVLTKRLTAVLTPAPEPDPNGTEVRADGPSISPLATQLEANNYGIRKATKKLEALMGRIEC